VLCAHTEALLWRQAVDGALDVEGGIDAPHRLHRERRFRELGQFEQLSPPGCPTARFAD
jgi:hypothetical protein